MSNEMETLLTLLGLLFLLGIVFTPFVVFFVYVFYQNVKRKRIRERTLAAQSALINNRRWFPVRYASAPRFKSWFKVFPWEAAGVIVMDPPSVIFLGETLSGSGLNYQFAPGNSSLNWLGKCPWPNGAVSWFEFETPDGKHYFSSETGAFIFGSNNSTKEIYDEGVRSFAGAPAR